MSQNPERNESVQSIQPETVLKEPEKSEEKTGEVYESGPSGVTPVQPSASVGDDQAQASMQDSTAPMVTITVPATPQQLQDWSKGSPDESLTWVAFFWIRMIKKALFYGWNVISGRNETSRADLS